MLFLALLTLLGCEPGEGPDYPPYTPTDPCPEGFKEATGQVNFSNFQVDGQRIFVTVDEDVEYDDQASLCMTEAGDEAQILFSEAGEYAGKLEMWSDEEGLFPIATTGTSGIQITYEPIDYNATILFTPGSFSRGDLTVRSMGDVLDMSTNNAQANKDNVLLVLTFGAYLQEK